MEENKRKAICKDCKKAPLNTFKVFGVMKCPHCMDKRELENLGLLPKYINMGVLSK